MIVGILVYHAESVLIGKGIFINLGIKNKFFIPDEYSNCNAAQGCSWEESIELCNKVGDGLAVPMESSSSVKKQIVTFLASQDDRRFMFYIKV